MNIRYENWDIVISYTDIDYENLKMTWVVLLGVIIVIIIAILTFSPVRVR